MYIAVTAAARVYQVGFRESLDLNRNMFPFFFLCICRIFDGLRKESGLVQSIQFVTVPKTPKEE